MDYINGLLICHYDDDKTINTENSIKLITGVLGRCDLLNRCMNECWGYTIILLFAPAKGALNLLIRF